MTATVSGLSVYPIKSTAGLTLAEAEVEKRGLAHDRRWLLVDGESRALTGREHPLLTQVQSELTAGALRVQATDAPPLDIPLGPSSGTRREVKVWGDICPAMHLGEIYDRWFSRYLGVDCHLVFMDEACVRPVDLEHGNPGDEVSFADGYPLLLIGEGSLADLNARLERPVQMANFRPNIVVGGCEAFVEDGWREVTIGELHFDVAEACARCVFTTVDPLTAKRDAKQEPLRTLTKYRRGPDGGVLFGQNLIARGRGTIRVGDPVVGVRR